MKTIPLLAILALALPACEKKSTEQAKEDARDAKESIKRDAREAKDALKDAAKDAKDKSAPTRLKIRGTWDETKGKLKQKFAQLTDDDLLYTEGKEDELYGRLEKRLGKNREEVEKILEDL
jgi:uncharacterized protein YjbJ (UPF0337 family)